jgi:hypothetical protein
MKSLLRLSLLLVLLLATVLPLSAQEPAEIDPAVINIPEEWEVTTATEFDDFYADIPNFEATMANQGDFWVMVMTPEQIDTLMDGETPETPVDALIAVYDAIWDYQIDPDEIDTERVSGFTLTGWHYVDDLPGEGEIHLLTGGDGSYYFIDVYGEEGILEDNRQQIDEVLTGLAAYARANADVELTPADELFIPEDWDTMPVDDYDEFFAEVQDLDGTVLLSDDVTVLVLTPDQVAELLDSAEGQDDPDTVMFETYNRIYDFEIFSDNIVDRKIGGVDVRAYYYTYGEDDDEPGEGETYVFPTEDGGWYFVDIYGLDGEVEKVTTDVDVILEGIAALTVVR